MWLAPFKHQLPLTLKHQLPHATHRCVWLAPFKRYTIVELVGDVDGSDLEVRACVITLTLTLTLEVRACAITNKHQLQHAYTGAPTQCTSTNCHSHPNTNCHTQVRWSAPALLQVVELEGDGEAAPGAGSRGQPVDAARRRRFVIRRSEGKC